MLDEGKNIRMKIPLSDWIVLPITGCLCGVGIYYLPEISYRGFSNLDQILSYSKEMPDRKENHAYTHIMLIIIMKTRALMIQVDRISSAKGDWAICNSHMREDVFHVALPSWRPRRRVTRTSSNFETDARFLLSPARRA